MEDPLLAQPPGWLADVPQSLLAAIRVHDDPTSADIFALQRSWDSTTLAQRDVWLSELHRAGVDVNAIDPVSGCASIHLVVQSAAPGVGDDEQAAECLARLIREGADVNLRCQHLGMTPLHYAAYFGAPHTMDVLLRSRSVSGNAEVDAICTGMQRGTALHLAVLGNNLECLKHLLQARANSAIRDGAQQRPIDLARSMLSRPSEFDDPPTLEEMIRLLEADEGRAVVHDAPPRKAVQQPAMQPSPTSGHANDALRRLRNSLMPINMQDAFSDSSSVSNPNLDDGEIEVGDRVMVRDKGPGIVRFKGQTKFKPGMWYGIQLDDPQGRNNGTVGLVTYFRTKPMHGCFVRRNRLSKLGSRVASPQVNDSDVKVTPTARQLAAIRMSRRKATPFTAPTLNVGQTTRVDKGFSENYDHYSSKQQRDAEATSVYSDGAKSAQPSPDDVQARFRSKLYKSAGKEGKKETPPKALRPTSLKGSPYQKSSPGAAFSPMHDAFGLQSRVLVGKDMGYVVYMGPTHLGDGNYIGVALDRAAENGHDGTVDGKRYFSCPAGRGMLKPANRVFWHGKRVSDVLDEDDD
ncbi:uncharacterized protein MONBRDRAFT_28109 [Monosiga brevicollis MX1]|uniref:CAP-Gly domain-containing protein n=1 Tax=Monosiga brevicollis TaxID=81824 RepID=A9V781_MONBE|nr:uncharacterized protein MONBRDRAFT_28109 [Monosiga brevicollis MX1]EDQ86744.1 predicted protein [Monosiga brevicollis MX1]|eukprot:XP_001748580.1 hypothetical protein [Monosiga brevicollis MX1]